MTPWTVACQAPLLMGFSRQEYWIGLSFPSPGDLPDLGVAPGSPELQADSLLSNLGSPNWVDRSPLFIHPSIHPLMDIWLVSAFYLVWIIMLRMFPWKFYSRLSFFLDTHQGVKLLGYMVTGYSAIEKVPGCLPMSLKQSPEIKGWFYWKHDQNERQELLNTFNT